MKTTDSKSWVAGDCFTALRELDFYNDEFARAAVPQGTTGILVKVKDDGSFRMFWENKDGKGHWTELSRFDLQCLISNQQIKYRGKFGQAS
ncbi:MAG: hypothetical protein FJZ43_02920 [Candidatus Staskawiczbacteria bacterium]|nr:hypothetical protein [Candidatus Staskawiczbacteria bacterium]